MASSKTVKANIDTEIMNAIIALLDKKNEISDTMTGFQNKLVKKISKRLRDRFPKSPAALRVVFNRISNKLRSRGISVVFSRSAISRVCTLVKNNKK